MITFRGTALAAAFVLAAVPALAQTAQDHNAHHPNGEPTAQGETSEPKSPQAGMMCGNMMGEGMASSGGMMSMMKMMDMGARSGAEHVEGRLAFLKAELKITDAQATQWNAFAEAIRTNAKSMAELHQSMMSPQSPPATLPERLALEDKAISAHLAALKKTESSLDALYGALSAEQKKTADGIVIGPMGMPMGMM